MQTITNSFQTKIRDLVNFLNEIAKGFERIAEEIDNHSLKTAMIAVAMESEQYAAEIKGQVAYINTEMMLSGNTAIWNEIEMNTEQQAVLVKGGEIDALCNNCDAYFTRLYEDVLMENCIYKNFKDIITYQLYAAKCAFMKIKLLNTIRFNNN